MAVTKALTKAVPHVKSSKVERWDLEMTYENDSEGDATYYTSTFNESVNNVDDDGATVFTKKAKGSWTKSELEALFPVSKWDAVFASQVDSVITSPVVPPVPDDSYAIPS
jgi:hypothetical protein